MDYARLAYTKKQWSHLCPAMLTELRGEWKLVLEVAMILIERASDKFQSAEEGLTVSLMSFAQENLTNALLKVPVRSFSHLKKVKHPFQERLFTNTKEPLSYYLMESVLLTESIRASLRWQI